MINRESCWSGEDRHLTCPVSLRKKKEEKYILPPKMILFLLFLDYITFYVTNREEGSFMLWRCVIDRLYVATKVESVL